MRISREIAKARKTAITKSVWASAYAERTRRLASEREKKFWYSEEGLEVSKYLSRLYKKLWRDTKELQESLRLQLTEE